MLPSFDELFIYQINSILHLRRIVFLRRHIFYLYFSVRFFLQTNYLQVYSGKAFKVSTI